MRTKEVLATAAVAAVATLVLSARGGGSPRSNGSGNASARFPVTIKHAFGETTIASMPERIATVAWANHEVPLALGIAAYG